MDGRGKIILILGNGFDLAHGLPTGYASFIEFCNRIICIHSYEGGSGEYYDEYLRDWNIHRTVYGILTIGCGFCISENHT